MSSLKKGRSLKGILTLVIATLLISGGIRLGSVGVAIASSRSGEVSGLDGHATPSECANDAETQELMTLLKARSERIAAMEEEQNNRQKALDEAEAAVLQNLQRVENAEAQLASTIQAVDGASANDISRLTSVYESMKPKDAALLFEQMSPDFAAGFLGEMSANAAAGILSGLSSEKAYAVSVVLAGRNANAPKQ